MGKNKKSFNELREKYNKFYFEAFNANVSDLYIELKYLYSFDKKIEFKHVLRLRKNDLLKENFDEIKFKKIILALGIIEGINYYKMICPKEIEIECMNLSEYEKEWFRKLYYKGLGEFRYLNNIKVSEEEFVKFSSSGDTVDKIKCNSLAGNLVLVGGGKDSITTLELLKEDKDVNNVMIINPRSASIDSAHVAGYDDSEIVIVERKIDTKIVEYNKEGYLNGHIPFSAMLSFLSTFVALLCGNKYVVVSNECSANEETVEGANHQYSKSLEYENDFRDYAKRELFEGHGVEYYSILRPLFELQIVKLFVQNDKYLKIFKSCNVGSKIIDKREVWCCDCPKCLFVFIMLLSQLPYAQVVDIFGEDMLDKGNMKEDFDKLIGIAEEKPFECIGTKDEVNAALKIMIDNKNYNLQKIPVLIEHYINECSAVFASDEKVESILKNFDEKNNVSHETAEKIKKLLEIR